MARPKRDDIDRIRTIYWFEGIRLVARVPTAYALERRVEPKGFGRNKDGTLFHRNKWAAYQHGRHTPSEPLVLKMEYLVTGSRNELDHVLWKVLRPDVNVTKHAVSLLRQLKPELQLLIFAEGDQFCSHSGAPCISELERRASIDALACLTILTIKCYEAGSHEHAWAFALSTFRVLLMIGYQLEKRGLAEALFNIYVERIFNKIRWNGNKFYFDEYYFPLWAQILHQSARVTAQHAKKRSISWREEYYQMWKFLRGDSGLYVKFAFDPVIGPDKDLGPWSEEMQQDIEQKIRFQIWGRINVLSDDKDTSYFPPPEIW